MKIRHSNRQANRDRKGRNRRRGRDHEVSQLEGKFYTNFGRDGE